MSFGLIYDEQAINQAAAFRADDPDGLNLVMKTIDELLTNRRPLSAFPLGSPNQRRLRVGRYRVVYDIVGDMITVRHIGRIAPER